MISKQELLNWINSLPEDGLIGIDGHGLSQRRATPGWGSAMYIDVGFVPNDPWKYDDTDDWSEAKTSKDEDTD